METKRINLGKWDTAYWESEGTGATIVFVHGNSSSKKIFSRQFNSDLADRYRLIAPDLPGHGETLPTIKGEEEYRLSIFTDFMVDFCDKLICEDVIFVGHSLGGHILLQSVHALEKPAGMIIYGAAPLANPPQTEEAFLAHHLVPLLFKEDLSEPERKTWANTLFTSSFDVPDFYDQNITRTDPKVRSSIGVALASNNFNDELTALWELKIPLAIFHGQKEQLINFNYLEGLNIPTLWRQKIEVIQDAGHVPHWEQPEKFNSLLVQFVDSL